MGNCCKIKTVPYKYSEHEDGSTHRNDGISILSDDCITSISANAITWVLSQEFSLSVYADNSITSSHLTSERVRSLCTSNELMLYGGKNIHITDYSGNERGKLEGHERAVSSLALNKNLLISGSSDWSLRLWDINSLKELNKSVINWNVITSVKWVENSIIQTSEDLTLRIWDIRDDRINGSLSTSAGDNFATCCDVKGFYCVTGHRGFDTEGCEAKLWDIRKMEIVQNMIGHQEAVEGVKFVGNNIVTCGKDGKLISFGMDGKVNYTWEHKDRKQFIAMDSFKNGILVASIEPKVYYFSINPFIHEA